MFNHTGGHCLYPLIPRPIEVNTESISGKLYIDGNIAENTVRFHFEFADPLEAAPVFLSIEAAGKQFHSYCIIRDERAVQTPVFHPEFCVGQRFCVKVVEPLARFDSDEGRKGVMLYPEI
jgi:hypothetical protein